MAKVLLVVAVALVGALAEPPVDRQYLPPGQGGYQGSPSAQYGAPAQRYNMNGRFGGSQGYNMNDASSRFGAPSSRYGAPGRFGGASSGSSRFGGAPGASSRFGGALGGSSRFSTAPSTQYGAPGAFSHLGGASDASSRFGGALSTQYGAPGASSRFGGAASSSYSAPGASSRYSGAPSPVYGAPGGGFNGYADSKALLAQDDLSEPANYEFSYEVSDAQSGSEFGHQENRQEDSAQGEYRVLLPDGRTQVVEYIADQEGFQPNIRYEEPSGPYAASQRSQGRGGPY